MNEKKYTRCRFLDSYHGDILADIENFPVGLLQVDGKINLYEGDEDDGTNYFIEEWEIVFLKGQNTYHLDVFAVSEDMYKKQKEERAEVRSYSYGSMS